MPAYVAMLVAGLCVLMAACVPEIGRGESSYLPAEPPVHHPGVWTPAPGTSWQIQLSGAINTAVDTDMIEIDLFDTPTSLIRELQERQVIVICYFSAGTLERWRADANRFDDAVIGLPNTDWPGEFWLDIRQLDKVMPIIIDRLELAVSKGCDGVDPDNVDGYINRTGYPLSAQDQLQYNRQLANEAHRRGLSVGLKNDVGQTAELEPWFDWTLNERCHELNECHHLQPFVRAGKAVFGIEYLGDPGTVCLAMNALNFDWLMKKRELDDYRVACR